MRPLHIAMYHHILGPESPPGLKGLPAEDFAAQMRHAARCCAPLSLAELAQRLDDGAPLPQNALLVTFDDGYASQFRHALPVLRQLGIPACFHPTVRSARQGELLDVNKIHLILGRLAAPGELLGLLLRRPEAAALAGELDTPELRAWLAQGYPRDDLATALAKYLLQTALPPELRAELLDELFARVVGQDQRQMGRQLYMGLAELGELAGSGMALGVHGDTHRWLTDLSEPEREAEIEASLALLRDAGQAGRPWSIAYPSGMHDEALRELLARKGCAVGLAVEPGPADLDRHHRLALPRVDAAVPGHPAPQ